MSNYDILKTMLNVFSSALEKISEKTLIFKKLCINETHLIEKFGKIERIDTFKMETLTFETNDLYNYFLRYINEYLSRELITIFNSYYSVLNFQRIIYYLQNLLENNINIVDDNIVKIFFYLLFLYFNQQNENEKKKIDLDETFFKGTFLELETKYSKIVPYEDSEEIKNFIKERKLNMEKHLIKLINYTFTDIRDYLDKFGDLSDEIMENMRNEAVDILFKIIKLDSLSNDLIEKVKKFYEVKEHLIFTNYVSEMEGNEITKKINSNFLHNIEDQYSSLNFNYNLSGDESLDEKLEKYLDYKTKYYKRMFLSSLHEIFKWNLDDEIIIFSFSEFKLNNKFNKMEKFKNKLKNLNDDKILKMIEDILDEDNFYKIYFTILKSSIVENFFSSNLYLGENDKEFKFLAEKEEKNSECFKDIYLNFLNDYDKKDENFKTFKDLIILKILPGGDRAYTLRYLKKIVINPAQFFLGKEFNDNNDNKIIFILKGYLMVILLHETEHYFRLLNKNKKVFDFTPRENEGGRLFIKYLFGVYTINHIDEKQANLILNIENWSDHQKIKNIFNGQIEDYEENDINEFILNHFTNSISFFKSTSRNTRFEKIYIKK